MIKTRHIGIIFASLILISVTSLGHAQSKHKEVIVFDSLSDDQKNYFYRIPSVVTVNKNKYLVAFAEERVGDNNDHGDINVVYKVSYDSGASWSRSKRVCEMALDTCGNPTAVVDQSTGVIHLFMMYNKRAKCQFFPNVGEKKGLGKDNCTSTFGYGDRKVHYVAGRFEGYELVWSRLANELNDLTDHLQREKTKFDLIGPGAGIQLTKRDKGRLLVPASRRTFVSVDRRVDDDNGIEATWKLANEILSPASSETMLMELDDGDVLRNDRVTLSWRSQYPSRLLSRSRDGGDTFSTSTYKSMTVPDPAVQGSMLRYSQGNLFFANCASSTHRRYLTIRMTSDGGSNWSHGKRIDELCGYSSMTKTRDYHVGILYERPADFNPDPTDDQDKLLSKEKPLDIVFKKFRLSYFNE